uniref:centrosomal protein of 83 kDa-like n=1 Tax=Myxine glutinosa TaxID=7769 RepID=UPI00358EE5BD
MDVRFHVAQICRQRTEDELNKVKNRAEALDDEKKELGRHISEVELQVEKLRNKHDYGLFQTTCHESAEGWGEVISECSSGTDVDELAEDVVTGVSKLLMKEREAAEKGLRSLVCKMLQKVEEAKEKATKDQRKAEGFRQEASQLRVEDTALHGRLDELQTEVHRQRRALLEVEEQFSKQEHRDQVKRIELKHQLMDLRTTMSQQVQEQEALEHARLHQQLQLSGLKRHVANALKDSSNFIRDEERKPHIQQEEKQ